MCCRISKVSSSTIPFYFDLSKKGKLYFHCIAVWFLIGTLRSKDADGNENVKKTKGLISKTTTLHVHHAFLYISFLFLHDFDVKMPNFAF